MDIFLLYKLATLCKLAYQDVVTLDDLLSNGLNLNYTDEWIFPVKFISSLNAQCWIFIQGKIGFIVFRGSDSVSDLLFSIPCSFDYIHPGHLKHYLQIKECILSCISDLHCDKFIVTGHSIGGSCALLFANDYRVSNCVLFGAPCSGSNVLYKKISPIHVVIHNDIVPILFPSVNSIVLYDKTFTCPFNHNIRKYCNALYSLTPRARLSVVKKFF